MVQDHSEESKERLEILGERQILFIIRWMISNPPRRGPSKEVNWVPNGHIKIYRNKPAADPIKRYAFNPSTTTKNESLISHEKNHQLQTLKYFGRRVKRHRSRIIWSTPLASSFNWIKNWHAAWTNTQFISD